MKRLILLVICILTVIVGCSAAETNYETTFRTFCEEAREMLWENIISKGSIAYEDLFFEDEAIQTIFLRETKEEVLVYYTHILVATEDGNTYTYGYYAVDVSLETIYEYEFAKEIWHKVECE